MLEPSPRISRGRAGWPKIVEPMVSTPTSRRSGKWRRSTLEMPALCPPVPTGTPGCRSGRAGSAVRGRARRRRPRCRGCCTGRDSRRRGCSASRSPHPLAAGLLPAADRVRLGDDLQAHPVRGQQPAHQRLHAGVGDQHDRMAEDDAGQRQAEPEGAAGRLDDRSRPAAGPRARAPGGPCAGAGRSLMPPGLKPSSLAQNPPPAGTNGLGEESQWRISDGAKGARSAGGGAFSGRAKIACDDMMGIPEVNRCDSRLR